ncbi:MAG: hypothetical protein PW788_02725 [Micavibrio sp.]|nr:hypothetical protein [Micavibrio sp.]
MGQLEKNFDSDSFETRELAWELQQAHPDQQRIRYLIDAEADVRGALRLANLQEKDLLKRPSLRSLQLQKHLHEPRADVAGL